MAQVGGPAGVLSAVVVSSVIVSAVVVSAVVAGAVVVSACRQRGLAREEEVGDGEPGLHVGVGGRSHVLDVVVAAIGPCTTRTQMITVNGCVARFHTSDS